MLVVHNERTRFSLNLSGSGSGFGSVCLGILVTAIVSAGYPVDDYMNYSFFDTCLIVCV